MIVTNGLCSPCQWTLSTSWFQNCFKRIIPGGKSVVSAPKTPGFPRDFNKLPIHRLKWPTFWRGVLGGDFWSSASPVKHQASYKTSLWRSLFSMNPRLEANKFFQSFWVEWFGSLKSLRSLLGDGSVGLFCFRAPWGWYDTPLCFTGVYTLQVCFWRRFYHILVFWVLSHLNYLYVLRKIANGPKSGQPWDERDHGEVQQCFTRCCFFLELFSWWSCCNNYHGRSPFFTFFHHHLGEYVWFTFFPNIEESQI